jgi:hypothetical protein
MQKPHGCVCRFEESVNYVRFFLPATTEAGKRLWKVYQVFSVGCLLMPILRAGFAKLSIRRPLRHGVIGGCLKIVCGGLRRLSVKKMRNEALHRTNIPHRNPSNMEKQKALTYI